MLRFYRPSRTLLIKLPRWRQRGWMFWLALFIAFDLLVSFADRPLAEAFRSYGPGLPDWLTLTAQLVHAKYYLVPLLLILPFVLAARQALEDGSLQRILGWCAGAILFVVSSVTLASWSSDFLKGLIGRTRPSLWFEQGEYGFAPLSFGEYFYNSLPSTHAANSFALALAFAFLFGRGLRVLLILAALAALSRVVVGTNYLTDALIGGALGVGCATLTRWFLRGDAGFSFSAMAATTSQPRGLCFSAV